MWPPKFKTCHVAYKHAPLIQGRFVVRVGLDRLATINMYTKYEVSMFTYYEDMNGDEKCQKLGWFGGLGVIQAFQGHHQHSHPR